MSEEKIHAGHLSDALYRYFENYKYLLSNSFVFQGWESDFMAQSKSGYFVEVENKISRGDFFRDFDKEKHRIFKTMAEGRSHFVSAGYTNRYAGDIIANFMEPYVAYPRTGRDSDDHAYCEFGRKGDKHGYWTNQEIRLSKIHREIHAPCTRVHFLDLSKTNLPHQFYYCSPAGLLKKEEVPTYAGLLEFNGSTVDMVKKAPYLHKREMDLSRIMAHKFYMLWRYKAGHGRKLKGV